jgi:hypothetical protein
MRTLALAALLSSAAIGQTTTPDAACGPQDVTFKVIKERSQHPTPSPQDGKALLYVFGWGTLGMDGKWIGALGGDRGYFPLQIDPGEHHLCARFSTRTGPAALIKVKELAFRSLAAKPGETYYVDLHVTGPYLQFTLDLLDPDEGKYLLASSTFSASRVK